MNATIVSHKIKTLIRVVCLAVCVLSPLRVFADENVLTFFGWSDQHVKADGDGTHLTGAIDAMNNPAQPIARDALEYLRKDLAKVPAGTPVVVATHLCFDAITNRDEFVDTFGNANVILVLGGHYPKATVNKYRGVSFVQLPSPAQDSAREVTVIRIDSDRLVAIPFDYEKGQWCADPKKILDAKIKGPHKSAQPYQ